MKKYLNKNLVILLLLVLIGTLLMLRSHDRAKIREQTNLVTSLNSSIKVWKDKNNKLHSRMVAIQTQNVKAFLIIKSKDSIVNELQKAVKKYKKYIKKHGSATVVHSSTSASTTVVTKVVYKDTTDCSSMQFKSHFNLNGWVIGNTLATKDSTSIDFKIRNTYTVIIGEERQGFLKRKKPFAEVINQNPYTEVKNLKTYSVSVPKPKRFGIGPAVTVGLEKDGGLKWVIGIGVQYNLIRF